MKGNVERLKEIDKELARLSVVQYNYAHLNPINIRDEYEKFVKANKQYSPQLRYRPFDAKPYIDALSAMKIPTISSIGQLLEKVRMRLLAEAKLLDNLGGEEFNTILLFGVVDDELVSYAKDVLAQQVFMPDIDDKDIGAQELGKRLAAEIENYGLATWTINYSDHASARVSVTTATKTITIKETAMFNEEDIEKILIHEIGTHVLRSINGSEQEFKIFSGAWHRLGLLRTHKTGQ